MNEGKEKVDEELRQTFRAGKDTLAEALFALQKEMPKIQKDSINPHFKNKYVSLEDLMEQILPVMHKNKLMLMQSPTTLENHEPALSTTIIHVPTGDYLESTMALMLDRENPQGQGSAITYARRYSLMAILGIVADADDDGNAGSGKLSRRSNTGAKASSSGRGRRQAEDDSSDDGDDEQPPF